MAAWLRVTVQGNLTLINADQMVKLDSYIGVDPIVQSLLTFRTEAPGAAPQQISVDQTIAQLSVALAATSVGGA